jgi:hypothetical protein
MSAPIVTTAITTINAELFQKKCLVQRLFGVGAHLVKCDLDVSYVLQRVSLQKVHMVWILSSM